MKILIIGSRHFASYETSCAKACREAGAEVCHWDNKACFEPVLKVDWWRLGRVVRFTYDMAASLAFVREVDRIKPDVVFMPKGENIHHRAVREAMERSKAKLVVWYPDNPFRAENTSMNILKNLERVDLFYIWGRFLIDPLKAAGCRRVEYLPFAFDPFLHDLTGDQIARDIPCKQDGSFSEEKRDALLPLASCGLQIWGPGWETERIRGGALAGCICGSGLYGKDMVAAYRRAVVIANPIRFQNMPAHNLRTIEAAGIGGGVVLTQRTHEQSEELFVEDEHVLCYGSAEEMKEKAIWASGHTETCGAMAAKARERVFEQHLIRHRVAQMLKDFDIL